jgi:hypothetical protein
VSGLAKRLAQFWRAGLLLALAIWLPFLPVPAWLWLGYDAAVTAAYVYSVRRKPAAGCWMCGGDGTIGGSWWWPWAAGLCRRCKGKKGFIRLGARIFARQWAIKKAREFGVMVPGEKTAMRRLFP